MSGDWSASPQPYMPPPMSILDENDPEFYEGYLED